MYIHTLQYVCTCIYFAHTLPFSYQVPNQGSPPPFFFFLIQNQTSSSSSTKYISLHFLSFPFISFHLISSHLISTTTITRKVFSFSFFFFFFKCPPVSVLSISLPSIKSFLSFPSLPFSSLSFLPSLFEGSWVGGWRWVHQSPPLF